MVTAALAALAVAHGFVTAAVAALLLGAGGGWLNTAANALVSDVFHDDRGRMLNLLGTFFGIGALFVPAVIALSFGRRRWRERWCSARWWRASAVLRGAEVSASARGDGVLVRRHAGGGKDRGVVLFAILLLFQAGNESALSGWTSTYVGSVGWSPRVATLILLGYGVTAYRRPRGLGAGEAIGKERLVLFCGGLSVVGCIILLAAAGWLPGLAIGALLTSLGFSAIFPTVLAMAGDRYQRFAGTVFGFLFTVSNFGSIAFPSALGRISQAFGVRLGMLVPLAGTLAVTALALVVRERRTSNDERRTVPGNEERGTRHGCRARHTGSRRALHHIVTSATAETQYRRSPGAKPGGYPHGVCRLSQ